MPTQVGLIMLVPQYTNIVKLTAGKTLAASNSSIIIVKIYSAFD
jgi:hypothetical protein